MMWRNGLTNVSNLSRTRKHGRLFWTIVTCLEPTYRTNLTNVTTSSLVVN